MHLAWPLLVTCFVALCHPGFGGHDRRTRTKMERQNRQQDVSSSPEASRENDNNMVAGKDGRPADGNSDRDAGKPERSNPAEEKRIEKMRPAEQTRANQGRNDTGGALQDDGMTRGIGGRKRVRVRVEETHGHTKTPPAGSRNKHADRESANRFGTGADSNDDHLKSNPFGESDNRDATTDRTRLRNPVLATGQMRDKEPATRQGEDLEVNDTTKPASSHAEQKERKVPSRGKQVRISHKEQKNASPSRGKQKEHTKEDKRGLNAQLLSHPWTWETVSADDTRFRDMNFGLKGRALTNQGTNPQRVASAMGIPLFSRANGSGSMEHTEDPNKPEDMSKQPKPSLVTDTAASSKKRSPDTVSREENKTAHGVQSGLEIRAGNEQEMFEEPQQDASQGYVPSLPRTQAHHHDPSAKEWETEVKNMSSAFRLPDDESNSTIIDTSQGFTTAMSHEPNAAEDDAESMVANLCMSYRTSCKGRCDRRQIYICSCDQLCQVYRDCCEDYFALCHIPPDRVFANQSDSHETVTSEPATPNSVGNGKDDHENTTDSNDYHEDITDNNDYHDNSSYSGDDFVENRIQRIRENQHYRAFHEEVTTMSSHLTPASNNRLMVLKGCIPGANYYPLLHQYGLNVTDSEVRGLCLNPGNDSIHEIVPVKGTRPSGLSLIFLNIFCAVCSGCTTVRPVEMVIMRDTPLDVAAADALSLVTGREGHARWRISSKVCTDLIPLPKRRLTPDQFQDAGRTNVSGNGLTSDAAAHAGDSDGFYAEPSAETSAGSLTPGESPLAPSFSAEDRTRFLELCNSYISYVEIPALSKNHYRNKYCYLARVGIKTNTSCSGSGINSWITNPLLPEHKFTYAVRNILGNMTGRQFKTNKRPIHPYNPASSSSSPGIESRVNNNQETDGEQVTTDPANEARSGKQGDDSPCSDDQIAVNSSCLPVLYHFNLRLEMNFTASPDSGFKSEIEENDVESLTNSIIAIMEEDAGVSKCETRGVVIRVDSGPVPHEWVQDMRFSCHVDANDTARQELFIQDMTQKLKNSFANLVEHLRNPTAMTTVACIKPTSQEEARPGFICSENNFTVTSTGRGKDDDTLSTEAIISITCCVLSNVGLLTRIALQFVIPFYNSYPGKIQFCLCLMLLLAYTSFLMGGIVDEGSKSCELIGIFTHVTFLSAIFWMNITAFEIWRTFKDWRSQVKPKGNASLALPAVYALGVPLAIVGAALVMDHFYPDNIVSPAYGDHNCWLSKPFSVIAFFVVPCSLICVINTVFVAFTMLALRRQRESMVELKKAGCVTTPSDLAITVKIALLVGVTWLLGLVASLLDYDVVWMIFTVVNASLGFMIAVVLLCNRRVLFTLRRACNSQTSESTAVVTTQVPRA